MAKAILVAVDSRGALLAADEVGDSIWRVAARPE